MNKNKTNKQVKLIFTALSLAATTICSQAVAQNVTPNNQNVGNVQAGQAQVERVVMKGKLIQTGSPNNTPVNAKPLQGFAEDLPLITVLKQVTPNGWIVKKNDSPQQPLNTQKLVSWQGGQDWVSTLASIAQRYNLDFLVNWNDNSITVSNSAIVLVPKQAPKVAVFELAGTNDTKSIGVGASEANNNPVAQVAPASVQPAPPPVIQWRMDPSKSLKRNVEEWASRAQYRVVWTGVDYPVDLRTLTGNFDEPNGPIAQLSKDYGFDEKTGSPIVDQPLAFQIYQNRTLVVENATFEHGQN